MGTYQGALCRHRVVHAERDPLIVAKVELGKVALRVASRRPDQDGLTQARATRSPETWEQT